MLHFAIWKKKVGYEKEQEEQEAKWKVVKIKSVFIMKIFPTSLAIFI